ncbi:restriction endonuclease subunit S [Latilactobacillus sakei]|uniref:restriction endonuclease subunit S n=1 Tax=Latilactobacillus sakei TaxID=1599 RepID=UPI0039AEA46A
MRYKLSQLIELTYETNGDGKYKPNDVMGMTITKEIIPTKAKVKYTDLSKFLVVKPNQFVYNPRTHGKRIGLGFNDTNNPFIISWNNIAFKIIDENLLNPTYLFIYFKRDEWDRLAAFNSWGSSTEVFSWNAMCDMEIDLPPLEIQEKYVAVYKSLVANQRSFEKGLEDLKLVCDATIEKIRRELPSEEIGAYIQRIDVKNKDNKIKNVKGVSVTKQFREPTSKVDRTKLSNYKIVKSHQISFVQTTNNEKVFAFALNNTKEDIVVTSVNEVFKTNPKKLLSEFLAQFLSRHEFDRYARFHSWGSARETFVWEDLCKVKIPIPDIGTQRSIVNIYNVYIARRELNDNLKQQIKGICPILINGAIREARMSVEIR